MTIDIRLSDLLARTVEEGNCLLWTGHANSGKFPQWRVDGKLYAARRIVYEVVHGEIPRGMQVGVRCKSLLCVHPDCLVARSRSRAMSGNPLTPHRRVAVTIGRRKNSALNLEIVRAIRASDEPGPVVEARYGLKKGYASRIRTNRCWVDTASPFAGLGARA